MSFSFIISVLLARLLGAAGYGTYSYAMAWISVLSVPALFGLDRLLVRQIAVYQTQSAWGLMRGLLCWATRTALIVSLGLAFLAGAVIWILSERLGFQLSSALCVGLFILPFATLVDLRQAAMQGLNHVVVALFPEFLIRPLALLLFLGCAYLFLKDGLNAQLALVLNAVAIVFGLVVATHLLQKLLPQRAKDDSPVYQTGAWVRCGLPLMLISGMQVINHRTDTVMLGAMKDAEAVGIYTVANRGAQLILLIQTAIDAALAPTIAGLYAAGKMDRLQSVITKSAFAASLLSLIMAFALIALGDKFLALFGSEFIDGWLSLIILTAGCVFSTAAGVAALLLTMTGHEHDAAVGVGVGVGLNVLLNMVLIPGWGVEGASMATCISMIARNILMTRLVYQRVGIHSTVLGAFIRRRPS